MPAYVSLLSSLIGGLSYHYKFLPNQSKCLKHVTGLIKGRSCYESTPGVECLVIGLP